MKSTIYLKGLKTALIILFVTVLFIFVTIMSSAASNPISLRLTNKISGGGLGSSYSPELVFNFNRSSISLGANIQKRKTNLSGINAEYQYYTGKQSEKVNVFFYGDAQYHHSAILGKSSCNLEERVSDDLFNNHAAMNFRVVEAYGGFGLRINHNSLFSSQFSIGTGMYHTLDRNYNDLKLYRDKTAMVLQLKWSVTYNLYNYAAKKSNKSKSQR